jgi:hypothetical protein
MRWFNWIRPAECEIAGCLEPPVRRAYILASAPAWLCAAHAATGRGLAETKARTA